MPSFYFPRPGLSSIVFFWKIMLWPAWMRELESREFACEPLLEEGPLDDGM
jgi:hypothetical protein